jgi:hypothetical protein
LPSRLQNTSCSAVEIEPERGGAEAGTAGQTARARDVNECALAGVAKQPVLSDARDQEVRKTVVVEIPDGDAHAVHLDVETRAARHVRKRAVAVVAVQTERRSLPLMPGPVHAVDEQNVGPAVGVVVDERAAGAERFGQQLPAISAAVMAKADAGCGRHIGEAETRRGLRRRLCEQRLPVCRGRHAGTANTEKVAAVQGSVTRPL